MSRRKVLTGTPIPKALACGMLEDGGRVLFLVRSERGGNGQAIERFELPCILVPSGRSPFADMKIEFERQTGIECQVHEVVREGRHNAGSRKRRQWVPLLVFKITARTMRAKPSQEFSGFRWIRIDEAKKLRLSRNSEWLKRSEQDERNHEGKKYQPSPE
jgi:hypothetical protein